jgi:hypothetical protein
MRLDQDGNVMTDKDLISDVGFATQRSSADAAPVQPPSPSDGGVVCPQCGALNPAGAKVCKANPKCGSFLPANQAARTTGIYARSQPSDIHQHAEAFTAGVISDLGGASELTTLENSYVRKLGDIDVTIRLLTHDIATNGLLTPGGRVRDVYDKLLSGLAAFDRYAQRVGLERRSKRVQSVADIIAEHEATK